MSERSESASKKADRLSNLGFVLVLTVAWVLFWGDLTVANLLTGVAAAVLLLSVFPVGHDVAVVRHRLRPLAAVAFVAEFTVDLVWSSALMVRAVLGGSSRERPGVVACPLRVDAPGLTTFLTTVIANSPGTMPIEATQDPPVIYVHVLHLDDPERVRARVSRLEELAVRILGDQAALDAVRVPPPPPPHQADRRPA